MPVCVVASAGIVQRRLSRGRWKMSIAPELRALGTAKREVRCCCCDALFSGDWDWMSEVFLGSSSGVSGDSLSLSRKRIEKAQKFSALTGRE